jgi:hypothetical protein
MIVWHTSKKKTGIPKKHTKTYEKKLSSSDDCGIPPQKKENTQFGDVVLNKLRDKALLNIESVRERAGAKKHLRVLLLTILCVGCRVGWVGGWGVVTLGGGGGAGRGGYNPFQKQYPKGVSNRNTLRSRL